MDDKKIAFIFGSSNEDSKIYEGNIDKIGDMFDGYFHSTYLLNYANEKYPEVSVFKKLSNRHTPEAISFFYTKFLNHIVFLNTTKYLENGRISKHGKTGVFLLPDNITEKQKEALDIFLDEISDYHITIAYDIRIENGIVLDNEVSSLSSESPRELFDKFFDIRKSKSL